MVVGELTRTRSDQWKEAEELTEPTESRMKRDIDTTESIQWVLLLVTCTGVYA